MTRTARCVSFLALAAMAASFSLVQAQPPAKDTKPVTPAPATAPAKGKDTKAQPPGAKPGDHAAPPGVSEADMQACAAAATPGPMHEHLAALVGTWSGTCKMWMPGATEAQQSECTSVYTSMMDGRFVRCETNGEMPGMGPFTGFGVFGYDNVGKKFQSTCLDNCGTGMMTGTGDLSADGKTLNWTFDFNCPMNKGPIKVRQVERRIGANAMTLEMFGPDPTTGKEQKMMEIAYTRKAGAAAPATAAPKPAK